MKKTQRVRYEMFVRVRDFGIANVERFPQSSAGGLAFARVTAAVVITDGDITYPSDPVPFAVLWALPRPSTTFQPPYGRVIVMQEGAS